MKLRKAEIWVLAATLLFLALTIGFHLGRSRTPAAFSVRTAAELTPAPVLRTAAELPTEPSAQELPVNINTAGKDELCTLSGIGETLAGRIIAYREENGDFSSIEDITKVSGIGSSTFEKLRSRITVD